MDDIFKIYTDRLQSGGSEVIEAALSPSFLEVPDHQITFNEKVEIEGTAYLAETHLVLQLDVSTSYQSVCKICNESFSTPITLHGLYITEELKNIKGRIYDFSDALKDALLLEIPHFTECGEKCPAREELQKYLKSDS